MLNDISSEPAAVLLMAPADNCVIARTALARGTRILIDAAPVVLSQDIAIGHKLARVELAVGEKVLRYGAIIGSVTQPIGIGEHIHTHNLASDYIPTFTLGQDGHHFLEKDGAK
ncbi:UxaA family hydrolase [Massilia sp. S19_KUP03_FR1]|uniref:UxaA family hydrolase n=1 Tax=Massilia sp. S19_KUP03_FR1 TaxID=3025503 RepID=UPI002FCDA0FA